MKSPDIEMMKNAATITFNVSILLTVRYYVLNTRHVSLVCGGPRKPKNNQRTRGLKFFGKYRESGVSQIWDETDRSRFRGDMEVSNESRQCKTFRRHKRYTRTSEIIRFRQRGSKALCWKYRHETGADPEHNIAGGGGYT